MNELLSARLTTTKTLRLRELLCRLDAVGLRLGGLAEVLVGGALKQGG
ncbi:MAG: hypothetical protein ACYCXN_04470 [Acidimicrobiales bacterium]